MFRAGLIALSAALVACGSGAGIDPARQTDGLGASSDVGAGSPSINGGAGSPSINGGAGSPSINGGAGGPSAGAGSGAPQAAPLICFDAGLSGNSPSCLCLTAAAVQQIEDQQGMNVVPQADCSGVASNCCCSTPGVSCICVTLQDGASCAESCAGGSPSGSVVEQCP